MLLVRVRKLRCIRLLQHYRYPTVWFAKDWLLTGAYCLFTNGLVNNDASSSDCTVSNVRMADVYWKLTEMERGCRNLNWDCPGNYLEELRNARENLLHDSPSPARNFKQDLPITKQDVPKIYSSKNYSQNITIPPIKIKRFTGSQWRNNNTNSWMFVTSFYK